MTASLPDSDRISEALPRTTETPVWARMALAAPVLSFVAPEPTGSRTMGLPSCVAFFPAVSMAATQESVRVPMFNTRAPA